MSDKFLVTSAPHPLKIERHMVEMPVGLTVAQIVERVQPDPVLCRYATVFSAGIIVPREMWGSVRPKKGTHFEVRVVPEGGGGGSGGKNPLRTILMVVVVVAAAAATWYLGGAGGPLVAAGWSASAAAAAGAAAGAVITAGGMLLVNAIAPVRPPSLGGLASIAGSGASGQRDSPTLFIEGARNQARPFSPVPQVLGRYRVFPPYGARPYTEVVGDKNFLRLLFVWGVGPVSIDTASLKIGETLLTEFEGVETEHREGYDTDTPHTLYPDTVVETALSVLLTQTSSWQTRTVATSEADELSIDWTFVRGLVQFGAQTGRRVNREVVVEIEYREVGATTWLTPTFTAKTFPTSWVSGNAITFTHKRPTAIRHGATWAVASRGQYEVRTRRTTTDTDSDRIFDEVTWTALRGFTNEDPIQSSVPLATTALRIQATDQLNRIIDEFNGEVITVGQDWNAALTTPAWEADQEIQNPSSLGRHVLQGAANAAAVGDARIDLDSHQDFHEFCDTNNFTFNMIRDFRSSVWETLADVYSVARASPAILDGKWSVVWDRPITNATSHITPRNSFDFLMEKLYPDLPHAWRLPFPNQDDGYRQDEVRVYFPGFTAANATKFELLDVVGITDAVQLAEIGIYRRNQSILQAERWTFQQDMEFLTYQRGDKVSITHDVILVGQKSGRICAVDADTAGNIVGVSLDEVVNMETGNSYNISIRNADDVEVVKGVDFVEGDNTDLSFTTPIPAGSANVVVGDIFGFGIAGLETDDASVVSIIPDTNFRARIAIVPYRDAIYDTETIPTFVSNLTPVLTVPVLSIRSVTSDEHALAYGPGESLRTRVIVDFDPITETFRDDHVVDVQVRPSETGEPYINAEVLEVGSNQAVLGGLRQGETWDLRLRFRVPSRLPGGWGTEFNHTVVGKSTAPSGLSGMTISAFGGQAHIRWNRPDELDVRFGGEVRFRHSPDFSGASWGSSVSIGEAAQARTLFAVLPLKPGTYLARVFDQDNNPSEDIVTVTSKQAAVIQFALTDSIDEQTAFTGVKTDVIADTTGELKLDVDGNGEVLPEGQYDFAAGFDFGAVTRVRLTTRIDATVVNVKDLIDDRTDNIDDWDDFDGTNSASGDCRVFVRHTDDDPALTSATWTAWERLDSAEFEARGFEFFAELTSIDPAFNVHVSELGIDAEEFLS